MKLSKEQRKMLTALDPMGDGSLLVDVDRELNGENIDGATEAIETAALHELAVGNARRFDALVGISLALKA